MDKKEPSWMNSTHYDIDDNVGNDIVIVDIELASIC
jgi:hypothetical protein